MPALTVQIGQAALVDNQRRASSPWAHNFQDASSDVDMGSLCLSMEGLNAESAATIANEVAQHYFDNATLSTEAALLRSVRHAYRYLYDARLESSLSDVGLTAVVVRDGRASIAQVLPTQFYLVQEEQLTALPATEERLAGEQSRPQQEDRHAQWAPPVEMFRATVYPDDVGVLCSENIGAVLSDREVEEVLLNGKPQAAAEGLVEIARSRGERDASVLVIRFTAAQEATRIPSTSPEEIEQDRGQPPRAPRAQPRGNAVTAVLGIFLALLIMGWSAISSLFRPRSVPERPAAPPAAGAATQSTIVTRSAAEEARRQRVNRIAAGIVVLLVLVVLVIGANALLGRDDPTGSLADEISSSTPQVQRPPTPTPGAPAAVTPSTSEAESSAATPEPPSAPDPGSTVLSEYQVLVQFGSSEQPAEIYGLNDTVYFLDRTTGAVYRIQYTGAQEVDQDFAYQPNSGDTAGSDALYVTGRADVIQIIDRDNRLFQIGDGVPLQAVQLPAAAIQDPRASATYDRNYYLLDAGANDVLRFRPVEADVYAEPEGYFGINSGVDLSTATDLAIDGSVYIMYANGEIVRYDSGIRSSQFELSSLPSALGATPTAIFISQGMGSLYILDGENDRVVQVTTEGIYQRNLVAPNRLFATATDIYVNTDETNLWIVGPSGLTRFPLPELPADAPRSPV